MRRPPPPRVDRADRPYRVASAPSVPSASRCRSSATRADTSEAAVGAASFLEQGHRPLDRRQPRARPPRRDDGSVARPLEPAAPQLVLGAGERDVEQPALLVDCGVRLRRGDRHQPVAQPEHHDGRPLQALGPVERRQHDVVPGGRVLGGRRPSASAARGRQSTSAPAPRQPVAGGVRAGRSPARGPTRRCGSAPGPRPWPPAPWPAGRWCG